MLSQTAKHVSNELKAKGIHKMDAGDVRTLVEMHKPLFEESVSVAHPISGEINNEMRINWKKCSAEYVHSVLKKHKII